MTDISLEPFERFCAENLASDAAYRPWPRKRIADLREAWAGDARTRIVVSTTTDGVKFERTEGAEALRRALNGKKRGVWLALPPVRNVDLGDEETDWDKEKLLFLYFGRFFGVRCEII